MHLTTFYISRCLTLLLHRDMCQRMRSAVVRWIADDLFWVINSVNAKSCRRFVGTGDAVAMKFDQHIFNFGWMVWSAHRIIFTLRLCDKHIIFVLHVNHYDYVCDPLRIPMAINELDAHGHNTFQTRNSYSVLPMRLEVQTFTKEGSRMLYSWIQDRFSMFDLAHFVTSILMLLLSRINLHFAFIFA